MGPLQALSNQRISPGLLEFYYDDTQQLQSDMGDHGAKGGVKLWDSGKFEAAVGGRKTS